MSLLCRASRWNQDLGSRQELSHPRIEIGDSKPPGSQIFDRFELLNRKWTRKLDTRSEIPRPSPRTARSEFRVLRRILPELKRLIELKPAGFGPNARLARQVRAKQRWITKRITQAHVSGSSLRRNQYTEFQQLSQIRKGLLEQSATACAVGDRAYQKTREPGVTRNVNHSPRRYSAPDRGTHPDFQGQFWIDHDFRIIRRFVRTALQHETYCKQIRRNFPRIGC
jgi:hypothetical protein